MKPLASAPKARLPVIRSVGSRPLVPLLKGVMPSSAQRIDAARSASGQRKSRLSLGSRAILCENQDLDAEGIGSRGDQSLSFPPIVMVAPILSQGVPLSISRLQK